MYAKLSLYLFLGCAAVFFFMASTTVVDGNRTLRMLNNQPQGQAIIADFEVKNNEGLLTTGFAVSDGKGNAQAIALVQCVTGEVKVIKVGLGASAYAECPVLVVETTNEMTIFPGSGDGEDWMLVNDGGTGSCDYDDDETTQRKKDRKKKQKNGSITIVTVVEEVVKEDQAIVALEVDYNGNANVYADQTTTTNATTTVKEVVVENAGKETQKFLQDKEYEGAPQTTIIVNGVEVDSQQTLAFNSNGKVGAEVSQNSESEEEVAVVIDNDTSNDYAAYLKEKEAAEKAAKKAAKNAVKTAEKLAENEAKAAAKAEKNAEKNNQKKNEKNKD